MNVHEITEAMKSKTLRLRASAVTGKPGRFRETPALNFVLTRYRHKPQLCSSYFLTGSSSIPDNLIAYGKNSSLMWVSV
jgi:hypothetical protein